jgi:hypothetical protein
VLEIEPNLVYKFYYIVNIVKLFGKSSNSISDFKNTFDAQLKKG